MNKFNINAKIFLSKLNREITQMDTLLIVSPPSPPPVTTIESLNEPSGVESPTGSDEKHYQQQQESEEAAENEEEDEEIGQAPRVQSETSASAFEQFLSNVDQFKISLEYKYENEHLSSSVGAAATTTTTPQAAAGGNEDGAGVGAAVLDTSTASFSDNNTEDTSSLSIDDDVSAARLNNNNSSTKHRTKQCNLDSLLLGANGEKRQDVLVEEDSSKPGLAVAASNSTSTTTIKPDYRLDIKVDLKLVMNDDEDEEVDDEDEDSVEDAEEVAANNKPTTNDAKEESLPLQQQQQQQLQQQQEENFSPIRFINNNNNNIYANAAATENDASDFESEIERRCDSEVANALLPATLVADRRGPTIVPSSSAVVLQHQLADLNEEKEVEL